MALIKDIMKDQEKRKANRQFYTFDDGAELDEITDQIREYYDGMPEADIGRGNGIKYELERFITEKWDFKKNGKPTPDEAKEFVINIFSNFLRRTDDITKQQIEKEKKELKKEAEKEMKKTKERSYDKR